MRALKVRNIVASYHALSELHGLLCFVTRGDAPRFARRLPLAIIFRAFGAAIRVTGGERVRLRVAAFGAPHPS